MTEKRKTGIGNPLPAGELPRMVLVYWKDSCYHDGYDTAEEAWPYTFLWDVGFVLRDDADGIVFTMEWHDGDDDKRGRHVSAIPRENIVSVRDLVQV